MDELIISIFNESFAFAKQPQYIIVFFVVVYLVKYIKDFFLTTYVYRHSYKLNKNRTRIENLLWLKNNVQISFNNDLKNLIDEQIKQQCVYEITGAIFSANMIDLIVHKYYELSNIEFACFKRAAKYFIINHNGQLDIHITTTDKINRYACKAISFTLLLSSILLFIGIGSLMPVGGERLLLVLFSIIIFMISIFIDSGTWDIQSAIKIKKAIDEQNQRDNNNE